MLDAKEFRFEHEGKLVLAGRVHEYPIAYSPLAPPQSLISMSLMKACGRRLEIGLKGLGEVTFEDGEFSMMDGDLHFKRVSLNPVSMVKGIVSRASGDEFFRQSVEGVGKIVLRDTLSYLVFVDMSKSKGKVVLEKGSFYASAGLFNQSVEWDMSPSNLLFSKRQKVITSLVGQGFVVLESPVPPQEISVVRVSPGRSVAMDGDIVLCRVGDIKAAVRTSGGAVNSLVNKTKLVSIFEGNGYIYTVPSVGLYNRLAEREGELSV